MNSNCPEDRKAYTRLRVEVKKEVIRAKDEEWLTKCEKVESLIGGSKTKEAWKIVSNTRQNLQEKSNVSLITIDKWKNYFQELLHEERNQYKETVKVNINNMENVEDITVEEIDKACEE